MVISVRVAARADRDRLIEFLREHWSATHIFVQRPEVFDWQYGDGERLNMVLAEDTETGGHGILGVLGFIPFGRFDPALGTRDITLAVWKVRDEGAPPGLGLRLLKMIQREFRPRLIAAIGTSDIVRPIYEVLGYRVGSLAHGAVFNPSRRAGTRIAQNVPERAFDPLQADPLQAVPEPLVTLRRVDTSSSPQQRATIQQIAASGAPSKSWEYIAERYLRHPWYRYDVRQVDVDSHPVGVIVWRTVEANGSRLLRVVDLMGDASWLTVGAAALRDEVITVAAEYIDLMHWGIDDSVFDGPGWVTTRGHDGLVLPNYFSPFEPRNVDIQLAVKVFDRSDIAVRLFRADSDQDRPNAIDDIDGPPGH